MCQLVELKDSLSQKKKKTKKFHNKFYNNLSGSL